MTGIGNLLRFALLAWPLIPLSGAAQMLAPPANDLLMEEAFQEGRDENLGPLLERIFGSGQKATTRVHSAQIALGVVSKQKQPYLYGILNVHLASDLWKIDEVPSAGNWNLSIRHLQAAHETLTHERFPAEWGIVHFDLGYAYLNSPFGDPVHNIRQAVMHYEQAARAPASNAAPWLHGHHLESLRNLLISRYRLLRDPADLDAAIQYGDELARDLVADGRSEDSAVIHLGSALLLTEEHTPASIEAALTQYERALAVKSKSRDPSGWAVTIRAMSKLYASRNGSGDLRLAFELTREALEVFDAQRDADSSLGTALDLVRLSLMSATDSRSVELARSQQQKLLLKVNLVDLDQRAYQANAWNLSRFDQLRWSAKDLATHDALWQAIKSEIAFTNMLKEALAPLRSRETPTRRVLEEALKASNVRIVALIRSLIAHLNGMLTRSPDVEERIKVLHELGRSAMLAQDYSSDYFWGMYAKHFVLYGLKLANDNLLLTWQSKLMFDAVPLVSESSLDPGERHDFYVLLRDYYAEMNRRSQPYQVAQLSFQLCVYAGSFMTMGVIEERNYTDEEIREVIKYCRDAESMSTVEGQRMAPSVSLNLGNAYSMRRPDGTHYDIDKATRAFIDGLLVETTSGLMNNLANSLRRKYQAGTPDHYLLERSANISEYSISLIDPDTQPTAYVRRAGNLAQTYKLLGRWDDAVRIHRRLVALAPQLLGEPGDLTQTRMGVVQVRSIYEDAAYAMIKTGDLAGGLVLLETSKGVLLDVDRQLNDINLDSASRRKLSELQSSLVYAAYNVSPSSKLEQLTQTFNAIMADTQSLSAAFGKLQVKLKPTRRLDLPPISVPQGSLLLEPVTTVTGTLFVVHAAGQQPSVVEVASLTSDQLDLLRGHWRQLYATIDSGDATSVPRFWNQIDATGEAAWRLFGSSLHDVIGRYAGVRHVFLIPPTSLEDFPIWLATGPDGKRLLDRYSISYVFSYSQFSTSSQAAQDWRAGQAQLSGWFNEVSNLDHVTLEEQLIRVASPTGRIDAATTLAAAASTTNTAVWHFATHGHFDKANPNNSGVFYPDNVSVLTLKELRRDPPFKNHPLVVLSACETGLADELIPGEFFGLAGGLLNSGARAVVGTLWPVDDLPTTLLIGKFYDNLFNGGHEIRQSLRLAQLWLRNATNHDVQVFLLDSVKKARERKLEINEKVILNAAAHFRVNPDQKRYESAAFWGAFYVAGV